MSRMKSRPGFRATVSSTVIPILFHAACADACAGYVPNPAASRQAVDMAATSSPEAVQRSSRLMRQRRHRRRPSVLQQSRMTDDRRHPLCPLAHRLPAYRRRRARRCSTGSMRAAAAARCCCGSRTPTASARPKRAIDAILDGLTWLGLDWDGDVVFQFARADAPPRGRRAAAGRRPAPIAATPRRRSSTRCARRRAREGRSKLYDGRWRDRDPAEAPAGVKPVIRLKAPLDRRDRDRGPGAGPRRLAEREPRRPRAAALRRHADLHARRRGRRPRHGRHPHHPRRRPPHQRRAPEADLRRARLGRCR